VHPRTKNWQTRKTREYTESTVKNLYWAKYTVIVSNNHCGQTFSTYLGRWEGRSPMRRGVQGAAPRNFCCGFLSIFGKNVLVLQAEFLEIQIFKKLGVHVTGRLNCSGPSRREVKIDVWKYLQTISWACTQFVSKSLLTLTVY